MPVEKVLDGDTVLKNGIAIHLTGVDAPELGPWARCWAEASLAEESKNELEAELYRKSWKIVDLKVMREGVATARLVDAEGYDISDALRVHGYVALTSGRWPWCKGDNLHAVEEGEVPPIGPQLWWPSGTVLDPRAND